MMVSILIPCYNVEVFLPQCLDSVLNQTYSDLQIVLVDDGSKDGTLAIAQDYARRDSRIEVYHQANQGVAAARNELLNHIRGEYFLFVDSDDWIELDMVEFLLEKAKESGADMCLCGMVKNDAAVSCDFKEEIWQQERMVKEFLSHKKVNGSLWNKLIDISLLHNERFRCGISYGEDALFCWHILQNVGKVYISDKELYHYRMNDGSISHSSWTPEKKGGEHIVWNSIVDDCKTLWPEYVNVAKVRYALEDMWAIYFAASSGYRYDEHIAVRQKTVMANIYNVVLSDIPSINMKLFAIICSISYKLCTFCTK